jgi:hypothetical protein
MDWGGTCIKIFKILSRNSQGGATRNTVKLSGQQAPSSNLVPDISRKQTRLLVSSGTKVLTMALYVCTP